MDIEHIDSTQGQLPEELRPHVQGEVRIQRLPSPFEGRPAAFAVHFEAGGRTRPHVHRTGQLLHITSGEGILADRSGRRVVGPGDVVSVSPGEWHWHGATPTSAMTHLTVQMAGADETDWDVDEGDWASEY
jgi:quercetin dioxygenase-like cupin family protein